MFALEAYLDAALHKCSFELLIVSCFLSVGTNDFVQSKSLRFYKIQYYIELYRYYRLGQFSFATLPFCSIGFPKTRPTDLIPLFLETASQSGSTQGGKLPAYNRILNIMYMYIFLRVCIYIYTIHT